jgi:hypothetical protein
LSVLLHSGLETWTINYLPFMSLTCIFIVIWSIDIFILLIDAVICQVHKSIAQTLT